MKHQHIRHLVISALTIAASFTSRAVTPETNTTTHETATDTVLFVIPDNDIAPEARVSKESHLGHFAWGIDAGSSVDITCNDMTSIDLHAHFGYKGPYINFLGAGAGINAMINNGSRCYPVYLMARTSFTRRPQLCFIDLRGGVSFNSIMNNKSQTDAYGSLGFGFNLATGRKFTSYLIISYNYIPLRRINTHTEVADEGRPGEEFEDSEPATHIETSSIKFPDLHYAAIRIGCTF